MARGDVPGPSPLPPEFQKQVEQTLWDVYRQVFDLFRASDSASASAEISRRTGESILLGVRAFVSSAQHADNIQLSHQNRLPVELWCSVWRHLSFSDLVFSTHVCREWRTAALNDPALWQHVEFYTTRHSSCCCCNVCMAGRGRSFYTTHAPGWKGNPYRQNTTNIKKRDFDALVARSRDLPLDVTVYVVPCYEYGISDALGYWLNEDHAQRLRGLTIFSADPDAPERILSEFSALPALRHLIVWDLPVRDDEWGRKGQGTMPSGLQLPQLGELGLSTGILLPPAAGALPFVRALWLEPTDLEADVRMALDACPGAVGLRLHLTVATPPRDEPAARWRERTAALRTVSAARVSAACERWLRAALPPALPALCLSYTDPRELSAGGAILSDLGPDIRLSVTTVTPSDESETDPAPGEFLVVCGTDGAGRMRQVSLLLERGRPSKEDLSRIVSPGLDNFWRNITAITACATLLPLVVSVLDGAAEITSLCVDMDVVELESALPFSPWQDGFYEPEFQLSQDAFALPALRSLKLQRGPEVLSLSSDDISVFVRGLRVPLPLEVLEIDRRVIAEDTDTPKDLADSVTVF